MQTFVNRLCKLQDSTVGFLLLGMVPYFMAGHFLAEGHLLFGLFLTFIGFGNIMTMDFGGAK